MILCTEPHAPTVGVVFRPYIYHIVYYNCIKCILLLLHHAMGRYSSDERQKNIASPGLHYKEQGTTRQGASDTRN